MATLVGNGLMQHDYKRVEFGIIFINNWKWKNKFQITYRRIKFALNDLSKISNEQSAHLVTVLFKEAPPKPILPRLPPALLDKSGELKLFNSKF